MKLKSGESTIGLKELEVLRVKKDTSNDPVNIALNKPAYASGNEANLDRLGPGGAFDGKYSNDYNERWSSGNITKSPQWIYVDLEAEMTFSSIHIFGKMLLRQNMYCNILMMLELIKLDNICKCR